ncbi:vWA domain-containing protein [Flavobacterium soli]|uniref:vWA domain-containing protein n=1 Tax=Flavobacterium soli TaxID=344881 RepID=UPI0004088CF3|nr:BatA and WFA domain-containing protein [Flavobacterium soli]
MQFKHPEILYFLFLLLIPILVHLFQLRRFKKEYFTNVRFLKELSIQTRKSSKLKKWLLLATRLLILACIVLAFAQPFFKAKDSNNTTNEMYIILDNSFSMQAKGQKGELLKRAVEDVLEHAPENQTFSLITNSETFWNTDVKSIQKELQNLKYSAFPFQLESLMAKVKSRKSPYNKDVIIISDAVGLEAKDLKSISPEFNTYFINPKSEQKNNISIDSVFIENTLDNFYEIGVKLSAYGENSAETPIAIYNNKKLIAKTLVQSEEKQKTINFTIPKEDFHGYASVSDNSLEYDNQLFFSITKPEKTNVISIGSAEKNQFLSKIYTEKEFTYSNFELNALDYNLLEKQDAIVLNELKEIPQALQTTLKSFIEKGGNVVLIPSEESSISNLNSFVSNFGNIQFKTLQNTEKTITKIAFNHPLYASVFEKKIDNFQYPNTKIGFQVASNSPAVLGYSDQSAFLTALQNQVASLYVFSAPINKANSNFQNSPLIVPTFYNMAQSSQKTGISAIKIGNNNPVLIDALMTKDEIVSVKNADENFVPVQQILNNKVKLTFNDYPKLAGNFGIYKKDELLKNISFNYDRTESDVTSANSDLLDDYKVIDSIETVFDTLQTDRTNNEIWKWFLFLTLLFLITELFIQKFVK